MQGYLFKATVTGTGPFPIDMLRYDGCYPNSETRDSSAIASSLGYALTRGDFDPAHPNQPKVRSIEVVKFVHGRDQAREPFTIARWASFGWKVTDVRQY